MYLKKYFFDIAVSVDAVDIDLGNVVLSHYRVAKMRQQDLVLRENTAEYKLEPGEGLGTAKPKDRQEEFLSQIINRLNEVFVTDQLTDKDMVNYAYTIRDKVGENILVMKQIENNSPEQALLGDFSKAIDDAILDSSEAHQNLRDMKARLSTKMVCETLEQHCEIEFNRIRAAAF